MPSGKEFPERLDDLGLYSEDRVRFLAAKVEKSPVEPRFKQGVLDASWVEGERCLRSIHHLQLFRNYFDSFFRDLARHNFALDEDNVFLVEGSYLLGDVDADLCFGRGHLDNSGHVTEEDEGYSSEDSDIVNPAGEDDILVQVFFELGGKNCSLEMTCMAGLGARQGCSASNDTRYLFF